MKTRIHEPSGATGTSRESRKQVENKRIAFKRMAQSKEFMTWAKRMAAGQLSLEAEVARQMQDKYILVEYLGEEV